jgi:tripartite-type tricarboxylate transporter receptor subunit TctC
MKSTVRSLVAATGVCLASLVFAADQAPAPTVNADMMQVLAMPEVGGALAAQGMKVAPSSPDEMAALMRRDSGRWAAVIKHAGIKAE